MPVFDSSALLDRYSSRGQRLRAPELSTVAGARRRGLSSRELQPYRLRRRSRVQHRCCEPTHYSSVPEDGTQPDAADDPCVSMCNLTTLSATPDPGRGDSNTAVVCDTTSQAWRRTTCAAASKCTPTAVLATTSTVAIQRFLISRACPIVQPRVTPSDFGLAFNSARPRSHVASGFGFPIALAR